MISALLLAACLQDIPMDEVEVLIYKDKFIKNAAMILVRDHGRTIKVTEDEIDYTSAFTPEEYKAAIKRINRILENNGTLWRFKLTGDYTTKMYRFNERT